VEYAFKVHPLPKLGTNETPPPSDNSLHKNNLPLFSRIIWKKYKKCTFCGFRAFFRHSPEIISPGLGQVHYMQSLDFEYPVIIHEKFI
jgi:hypothetical protein